MNNKLPKAKDCIEYVKSLGYKYMGYGYGGYCFRIIDPSTRPAHNHEMFWTLRELRDAIRFGC